MSWSMAAEGESSDITSTMSYYIIFILIVNIIIITMTITISAEKARATHAQRRTPHLPPNFRDVNSYPSARPPAGDGGDGRDRPNTQKRRSVP